MDEKEEKIENFLLKTFEAQKTLMHVQWWKPNFFLFSSELIESVEGKARQQQQIFFTFFFCKKRLKEKRLKDVFYVRLSLLTLRKHLLFNIFLWCIRNTGGRNTKLSQLFLRSSCSCASYAAATHFPSRKLKLKIDKMRNGTYFFFTKLFFLSPFNEGENMKRWFLLDFLRSKCKQRLVVWSSCCLVECFG